MSYFITTHLSKHLKNISVLMQLFFELTKKHTLKVALKSISQVIRWSNWLALANQAVTDFIRPIYFWSTSLNKGGDNDFVVVVEYLHWISVIG